jgi:hypothetical protein
LSDWVDLDTAIALAGHSGATDQHLNEILGGAFKGRRIGITALLEHAPIERVRVHWPVLAAELDFMRLWFTPQHIEEFLTRAIGPACVEPDNKLRAVILWGGGAPPYEADTCIFRAVHLYRPALVFELEAAGFAMPEEDGPRPQGGDLAARAWPIALQILEDDAQHPPRGYGGLTALARLVNAELTRSGHRYQDDSVRKAIGRSVREWESRHPHR